MADAAERLRAIAGDVEVTGRHVRGRVARAGRAVPGLLRELDRTGVELEAIEVVRPTLDDVFLTLTGRSLRDAESSKPAEAPGEPAAPSDVPEGALQ